MSFELPSVENLPISRIRRVTSGARASEMQRDLLNEEKSMIERWFRLHSTRKDILYLKEIDNMTPDEIFEETGCKIYSVNQLEAHHVRYDCDSTEMDMPSDRRSETIDRRSFLVKKGSLWDMIHTTPSNTEEEDVDIFYFVSKWSSHWNYLSKRNSFIMASKSPILHYSIEILFRSDILCLVVILALYAALIDFFLITMLYSDQSLLVAASTVILVSATLLGAHVIRGSLFDGYSATKFIPPAAAEENNQSKTTDGEDDDDDALEYPSADARAASNHRRYAIQCLWKSMKFPFFRKKPPASKKIEMSELDGFYHLLDIAARFLDGMDENASVGVLFKVVNKLQYFIWIIFPLVALYSFVERWRYFIQCVSYDDRSWCGYSQTYVYWSFFHLIPFACESILYVMFATVLNVLVYGSGVACGLTFSWIVRYSALRRVTIDKTACIDGEFKPTQLAKLVKRDAFERYLFIQHVMKYASKLWGFSLSLFFALSLLAMIYAYGTVLWYYSNEGYVSIMAVLIGATAFVVFGFILLTLMYANSAVDLVLDGILNSSKDDYEFIGNRGDWIEFINQAPCYWYIFGFAITRTWLAGFLGGGVVAVSGAYFMSWLR